MILLSALAVWRFRVVRSRTVEEEGGSLRWSDWWHWTALAFIPSSLMLGVTTYLSTVAPVPLLWVVPLGLYLMSFILVFAGRPIVPQRAMVRALPPATMILAFILGLGLVQPFLVPVHLGTFFLAAMVCHGSRGPKAVRATSHGVLFGDRLRRRPGWNVQCPDAPVLFDRIAEYPFALVLACLVLPQRGGASSV